MSIRGNGRSPGRAAQRLEASAFVVIGLLLCGTILALASDRSSGLHGAAPFAAVNVLEVAAFLTFVLLGSLLVLRRPGHPIGWLFALLGLSVLTQQATQEYALHRPALAGGGVAAWVSYWAVVPALIALIEVLLLFPTGHPPSPRWRPLVLAVAVGGVVMTVGWATASWPLRDVRPLTTSFPSSGLLTLLPIVNYAVFACLPVAAASLVWRFRRARGEERQQLKWLALAATGLLVAAIAGMVAEAVNAASWLVDVAGVVSSAGVAVAVALAILRYRLYDIDRLLSRTLSYGLLTVLLAAVYGLGVVFVGALLEPFASDSTAAVAVSTLGVAALFTPLRRRIQGAVDRRFNRARYDAQRTVAAFHGRLRAEVRLDTLAADLVSTVERTVQPVRVSLWLRPPAASKVTT